MKFVNIWKLQNHTWVKDPFRVGDRLMGFHVTEEEKFTDMALVSPFNQPLRSYHLLSSSVVPKKKIQLSIHEKVIKYSSLF